MDALIGGRGFVFHVATALTNSCLPHWVHSIIGYERANFVALLARKGMVGCDVRGARLSRANMHRGTTRGALSAERHFWLMSMSTRTGLGCKKSFWEE